MTFPPPPASLSRRLVPAALLAIACALGGCAGDSRSSMASLSPSGTTLAFDSIDGPPQEVFDALVRTLEAEAQTRNLAIVSREAPASYRLRGYYSVQIRRGQAAIAWVWDIYDSDQQREVRLSGEEPVGRGSRNAWTAVNDQILRNITRRGMDGIAGLLGGSPAPTEAPAVPRSGPAIAAAEAPTGLILAFGAR